MEKKATNALSMLNGKKNPPGLKCEKYSNLISVTQHGNKA